MNRASLFIGLYLKFCRQSGRPSSPVPGWYGRLFERITEWLKRWFRVLILRRLGL